MKHHLVGHYLRPFELISGRELGLPVGVKHDEMWCYRYKMPHAEKKYSADEKLLKGHLEHSFKVPQDLQDGEIWKVGYGKTRVKSWRILDFDRVEIMFEPYVAESQADKDRFQREADEQFERESG